MKRVTEICGSSTAIYDRWKSFENMTAGLTAEGKPRRRPYRLAK